MSNTRSELDEKHKPRTEEQMRKEMAWMNDRDIREKIAKHLDALKKDENRPLSASSSAALEEEEKKEEKANDAAISASIMKDLREQETQKPKQSVKPVYTKPEGLVSLIPETSVPHKSNVKKMSDLVIHKIASYLDHKEAHRFFATSRHTHHVMENKISCINTTFYRARLEAMLKIADQALFAYQDKHCGHSGFTQDFFHNSKYESTLCFRGAIKSRRLELECRYRFELELRLRMFGLYVLLSMNSTKASNVKKALLSHFGPNILEEIHANVRQFFGNDSILLEKMKKQFLSYRQSLRNDLAYTSDVNSMEHFRYRYAMHTIAYLKELESDVKAPKKSKGGCNVS